MGHCPTSRSSNPPNSTSSRTSYLVPRAPSARAASRTRHRQCISQSTFGDIFCSATNSNHANVGDVGRPDIPGSDTPPPPAYTVKQHLKDTVYVAVHVKVIDELKSRFDTDNMKELYMGLDALNPKEKFKNWDVKAIVTFAEQYWDDFDLENDESRYELKSELSEWYRWMTGEQNFYLKDVACLNTVSHVLRFMVENKQSTMYKKVFMIYERAVCLPATSVEIERSFSAMKYIKNYLRNSMNDPRLCDLLLLYKNSNITSNLDLEQVLLEWYSKKERRIPI